MTYRHGVSVTENATSVVSPVTASAGLPVVFGTAPLHLAENLDYVNKPLLANSYGEAVKKLGYHSNWSKYTLCEAIKTQFQLYNVAPIVFVNVLDPSKHKKTTTDATINISSGKAIIDVEDVLLDSVEVKLSPAGQPLTEDTDYTIAFGDDYKPIITPISGGAIQEDQTTLTVTYDYLDPSMATDADLIGGVDGTSGKMTGLELLNQVFPLFGLVPGQILAPGWSHKPAIAAVMKAKAGNINGLFKAIALTDIDSSASGADNYTEVSVWKNTNNYTDQQQVPLWPKGKLGNEKFFLSSHFAGLACKTDAANGDIPYVSPSNKSLQIDGLVDAAGEEIVLGPDQASYLNGQGVVTALNIIGGWKLWGNRTGAYPGNSDPKDSFIPLRRMFNWVANTIILTYWQEVDDPTNVRQIQSVVDSLNIWLNGLSAIGALLGGRVEFREEENPVTSLADGKIKWHLFMASPPPGEDLEFVLEYDVNYLKALFG